MPSQFINIVHVSNHRSSTAASPKHVDSSSERPQTSSKAGAGVRKQSDKAQSPPKPTKRRFEQDNNNDVPAPGTKRRRKPSTGWPKTWFLNEWIDITCPTISAEEAAEAIEILPSVEEPKDMDQMSVQDRDSQPTAGSASAQSERLNSSSAMFRGVQKANGLVIDNTGRKIPRDVQELVTKHLRKARDSARLSEEDVDQVLQSIMEVWDTPEPTMSDIIAPPLFPLSAAGLAQGRDILWSTKPLPRQSAYPYALPAPQTDRHLGFPTTLKSTWTLEELAVADHVNMRPYSQPTKENIFPSFLVEGKSEAQNGTLYGAEGQLASAGAHCVNSWMHTLDLLDPNRTHLSADAIVFSVAVSQRQAVAYVHYFNPDDAIFYMSYVDNFYFVEAVQKCRDHVMNVIDWLLTTQQPMVRDALQRLHAMTKAWKKGRSAPSAVDEAAESFGGSEGSRSNKSQRRV